MSEIIKITETSRLIIMQDAGAENPAEEWDDVSTDSDTYAQWARGDVYVVVLERARVYAAVTADGTADLSDTRTEWDSADSLGSCYLSADYTAASVALEYFDLTADERATVEGMAL